MPLILELLQNGSHVAVGLICSSSLLIMFMQQQCSPALHPKQRLALPGASIAQSSPHLCYLLKRGPVLQGAQCYVAARLKQLSILLLLRRLLSLVGKVQHLAQAQTLRTG